MAHKERIMKYVLIVVMLAGMCGAQDRPRQTTTTHETVSYVRTHKECGSQFSAAYVSLRQIPCRANFETNAAYQVAVLRYGFPHLLGLHYYFQVSDAQMNCQWNLTRDWDGKLILVYEGKVPEAQCSAAMAKYIWDN
jgi:hypothetical protein